MLSKCCYRCGEDKPYDDFPNSKSTVDGKYRICKPCCRDAQREMRLKDPTRVKRANLKKNYNMTLEEWDAMLASQEGRCGICQKEMSPPCVDHCHDTGRTRGMLCQNCNRAIGLMGDNAENLQRAKDWVTWAN